MRTKRQILDELTKQEANEFKGFNEAEVKIMQDAVTNEDLLAIASATLSQVLVDGVLEEGYIIQSSEERRLVLFKTIFTTFKLVRDAEEKYEEQFKISEEK